MLCPVDKKWVRTSAKELGKVLIPESHLLHVVPSGQEAVNWEVLTPESTSSMLCQAGKKWLRASAMELGKVPIPESRLLHVGPSRQEVDDNRCN
jgi:hypothetical protein